MLDFDCMGRDMHCTDNCWVHLLAQFSVAELLKNVMQFLTWAAIPQYHTSTVSELQLPACWWLNLLDGILWFTLVCRCPVSVTWCTYMHNNLWTPAYQLSSKLALWHLKIYFLILWVGLLNGHFYQCLTKQTPKTKEAHFSPINIHRPPKLYNWLGVWDAWKERELHTLHMPMNR
jgi:hypothetical protein